VTPFLSLYTPTYRRPHGLARNLASVQAQTAVDDLEQIVIPDHVGVGIDGMYARVPRYAHAVHGRYVAFLCDDDVLAGPTVVEQVRTHATHAGQPALIVVRTQKNGAIWPTGEYWPPRLGAIDLNCLIVRSDIWRSHVHCYGKRYEGDFDFAESLWQHGVYASPLDLLFSIGGVSRGAAEPVPSSVPSVSITQFVTNRTYVDAVATTTGKVTIGGSL
jgi:glycosyltransferase involved in cell wall biosynthesis